MDNVNALLSFAYSLAAGMCASSLETAGLDPYVGFMHTDRPGRRSQALDIVEEFRAPPLIEEIDDSKDSLRFYYLGDIKKAKVEHVGTKSTIKVDEPLIF